MVREVEGFLVGGREVDYRVVFCSCFWFIKKVNNNLGRVNSEYSKCFLGGYVVEYEKFSKFWRKVEDI